MSFVYEVNLEVEEDCVAKFAQWLPSHIEEMLSFDGFISATWYQEERGKIGDQKRYWSIQYHLKSREHLSKYLDQHAARMRQEGLALFGNQFTAVRRLLDLRNHYIRVE